MNSLLIAKNIIKRFVRSKKELSALLILPMAAVAVMAFIAGQSASQNIKVGLVDLDGQDFSRRLISHIKDQPNIDLVPLDERDLEDAVRSRKVAFAIQIPPNFSSQISTGIRPVSASDAGEHVSVDSTSDAQDIAAVPSIHGNAPSLEAESFRQMVDQYIMRLYASGRTAMELSPRIGKDAAEIMDAMLEEVENVSLNVEYRIAGRQTYDDSHKAEAFLSSIGFVIVFVMTLIFAVVGTLMEDKRNLSLARMFASPVKEWEIAAGNLVGSLVLGVLQILPLLVVIHFVFGIAWGMEMLGLFLVLLCFLVATIGLGIGLSGLIKGSLSPVMLIALIIVPTSILGGCFIPESMMPAFMVKLGYAVPQKWAMDAIRQIVSGKSFQSIALNLVVILMFGLLFAAFGVKTLKPLDE